jgi:hypothetical protein
MTKQFEGEMCVLCRLHPSSRAGEHVLPRRLKTEMFPQAKEQYRWWINDEPLRDRNGQPREEDSWSINLPVCEACNGVLNQKFEQPAKRPIRRLMTQDSNVAFDGTDAMNVARWFLKTWLLWAHPASRDSVLGMASPRCKGWLRTYIPGWSKISVRQPGYPFGSPSEEKICREMARPGMSRCPQSWRTAGRSSSG